MIQLMLNDLRGKAHENLLFFFKISRLIRNRNHAVSGCLSDTRQGKTSLLRFIRHHLRYDTRIEHFHVDILMEKANNIFIASDHVCRHSHTFMRVREQGVLEIVSDGDILFCGRLGFFS